MIYDSNINLKHYAPMLRDFGLISNFIATHDLDALEGGRHEVGNGIFAVVNLYVPKEETNGEFHRKYIDIQYMVKGDEDIYFAPLYNCTETVPYSADADVGFCTLPDNAGRVSLESGTFAVFFPQDAHQPSLRNSRTDGEVRKIVFKVPVPAAK